MKLQNTGNKAGRAGESHLTFPLLPFLSQIAEKNTEMKILEQVTFTALRADKKFQPQVTTSTTQARLQQEIEQMKMKLNNLVLENRQAERILQEVSYWLQTLCIFL